MAQRYDVSYRGNEVRIEPHFCREWDETGGCYGTNPDHGASFEDAKKEVVDFYRSLSSRLDKMSEEEYFKEF